MSRPLTTVFKVTGTLTFDTAVHVGAAADTLTADMPLARNGAGAIYLPGTSLAGPMRAWWAEVHSAEDADVFFGRTPDRVDPSEGHASRILVEDVVVASADTEVRDHVRIDAATGAAKEGFKFDREIIPAGTVAQFKLRLDLDRKTEAAAQTKLMQLLAALNHGDIHLGGGKTRGLGLVRLRDVKIERFTLTTREGILALVAGVGQVVAFEPIDAALDKRLELDISWTSSLPVFNLGPSVQPTLNHMPLVSGKDGHRRQVIAGSSVKGALRAQAARICRTIFQDDPGDEHPLVVALFGAPGQREPKMPESEAGRPRPGLGAVAVFDCHVGPNIAAEDLRGLRDLPCDNKETRVKDLQVWIDSRSKSMKVAGWRVEEHVAIDRWTGGAAEALLYNVLAPSAGQAGSFRLTLNWDRVVVPGDNGDTARAAALALLILALRDVALGRVAFGYGATRGAGTIDVKQMRFHKIGKDFIALGFTEDIALASVRDGTCLQSAALSDAKAPLSNIFDAWTRYCKTELETEGRE